MPDLLADLSEEEFDFGSMMAKVQDYIVDLSLVIPKDKFSSLVLEILQEQTLGTSMSSIRIQRGAVTILQRAVERYLRRVFDDALARVKLSGRTTVCAEDLRFAHRLQGNHL